MNGFLVAAPQSGSGKTVVTLGLLRALGKRGLDVRSAKAGPDYIDPAFHAAATGTACINLDPWAMRRELIKRNASQHAAQGDLLIVEAMMGLFDGAADGTGSAADLAIALDLPIVLVVDASRMAHSIGALVSGFVQHRQGLRVSGVVLNRVGSARHEAMLRSALEPLDVAVLGVVPSHNGLALPSRHLGLVQASEHEALETFIERAADLMESWCDLDALSALIYPAPDTNEVEPLAPLAQSIAVARDEAFAFCYPHLLDGWRSQGAAISFFSPLVDEGPNATADAVYLPGGYPELHAGDLANAAGFKAGMEAARKKGAVIYGECGGYMVLGDALIDADGASHPMLGFLPLETSFAQRTRHLGYRRLKALGASPWQGRLTAHEFHYSTLVHKGGGDALFECADATGVELGLAGQRIGNVCGSYMHIIDQVK